MSNFVMSSKYVPTFLLTDTLKYKIQVKVMGRFTNQKNMIHLFTAKVIGEITKN